MLHFALLHPSPRTCSRNILRCFISTRLQIVGPKPLDMEQQTMTPPPSFRTLRVHTRVRTRTVSDENKCCHGQRPTSLSSQTHSTPYHRKSLKEISSSPSRGRTRARIPGLGLTLNTSCGTQANSNSSMHANSCCSPPLPQVQNISQGGDDPCSANFDDDLIFQMSPVLSCSPPFGLTSDPVSMGPSSASSFASFDSISRIEESTTQALAALWENRKSTSPDLVLQDGSRQFRSPAHIHRKRTRTDTVTQHHRGFSDSYRAPTSKSRNPRAQPVQEVKTLLDLSSLLHTTPSSPAENCPSPSAVRGRPKSEHEPFLYSFPNFCSSPIARARQARHKHSASRAAARGDLSFSNLGLTHSADTSLDSSLALEPEAETDFVLSSFHGYDLDQMEIEPPRLGPIRARKLQIQSGFEEGLYTKCADQQLVSMSGSDDANFISQAFRSASLDPEQESELGEEDNDSSFLEHPASSSSMSISSSSVFTREEVNDEKRFDESQVGTSFISTSLLASFPVYRSSHSHSSQRTRGEERGAGVEQSGREEQDTQGTIRDRGRSMRRLSAEHTSPEVSRGRRRLPVLTSHYAYPQAQAQAIEVYTHTSAAASLASL